MTDRNKRKLVKYYNCYQNITKKCNDKCRAFQRLSKFKARCLLGKFEFESKIIGLKGK